MTPALGVSCRRISLAVVVLPEPESPMTPRVSPGSTVKSTPSTALTHARRRRGNTPTTLGKYLASFSACSSGAMQRLAFNFLLAHDLVRKPVPTFRDHALSAARRASIARSSRRQSALHRAPP